MFYFDKGNQITSPSYPDNYINNEDQVQTLTVEKGYGIKIEFKDFNIEDDENCQYDFLKVCDSHNNCGGKLCGDKLPAAITVATNTATVVFHSDDSETRKGFRLIYNKIKLGKLLHITHSPRGC